MNIVVVGAGKMGLPLAAQFASRGATVVACDVNAQVVAEINAGGCPVDEPGVPALVADGVAAGRLSASTDTPAAVAGADAVVVIVPALLTEAPDADLSILEAVTRQVASALRHGMLVSYETTLPVGTTRGRFGPLLEAGSGLVAGRDFALVFSPERVKSQRVLLHLTQTPKVVGGIDAESAARGEALYRDYLGAPVLNVGTLEAAELVKLAGMLYRDVNIALANEIARYAEAAGVELAPVIAAANTDGEAYLLSPGIGVGGHCTPVYPYFLIQDGYRKGTPLTLAERARRINDGQAAHAADRLRLALGGLEGRRVLLLGLGFRPQVKEHLFSPAFLLREALAGAGARVHLHDPLYGDDEIAAHGFAPGGLDAAEGWDALVLVTGHDAYAALDFAALAARGVQAVVDGRNLWDAAAVRAAGLAYLGIGIPAPAGEAVTEAPIPITRPQLAGPEAEAAADAVRSGWILQGPRVEAFEAEFAAFVGAPHACAVSSGTAALHLALMAAGVGPGDEVVTVSHSFIATANSVAYCGATPVFVDVDPATLNLDPGAVERAIGPRTRAILCVHQLGMPCDLEALARIAKERGIPLVEDAACALGSEILWEGAWEKIGRPHGDVACFSFHPRKLLTTGDGGMITTRRADWDASFRLWRSHGMDLSAAARAGSRLAAVESYPVLGWNYRLTDVQAAIGREQLRRIPGQVAERRRLVGLYRQALAGLDVALQAEPAWARSNWQSLYLRLPAGVEQGAVMQELLDRGVASRRGVMNAHEEAPWRGAAGALPASEAATHGGVVLPLFAGMTDADVARVAQALRAALGAVEAPVAAG